MEQAESYIELHAECPNCGKNQAVEWVDETEDGKEEWTCETCVIVFAYCHPENQYGHAK